jgi:hypothetical protein
MPKAPANNFDTIMAIKNPNIFLKFGVVRRYLDYKSKI